MVLTCLFVGSKNGGSTFISGGTVDDSSDSCSVLSGLLIASVAKLVMSGSVGIDKNSEKILK